MAKVYPLHDAVLKIAHDAANRLVLRPVLDVADGDAAVSKKLLEIVTEIQEQGGGRPSLMVLYRRRLLLA